MALSEKALSDYSYVVADRFEAINTMYLKKVARQIKEIGQLGPANVRRLNQMAKMSQNLDEINKYLAAECNISLDELYKVYDLSGMAQYDDTAKYYTARGVAQTAFKDNRFMQDYLQSVKNRTGETFRNIANTTASLTSHDYLNIVDTAVDTVATGVGDYKSVIRDKLKDLAATGLRVTYASGRTRRLDSAVRMNILEGVRQINNGVREQAGKEFGADGVEISAHGTCAADHLDVQGKQYSKKAFEQLQSTLARPISTCNCRHVTFPIVLGISKPTYSAKELKQLRNENTKTYDVLGKEMTRYEASQLMRQIETQMRYAKDQHIVGKEADDEELVKEANAKLKALRQKYEAVAKSAGLRTDYSRAYVPGYGGKQVKPKPVTLKQVTKDTLPTVKEETLSVISEYSGDEITIKMALDSWAKNAGNIRKASNGVKYDTSKLLGNIGINDEAKAEVIEKWIQQGPEIKDTLYRGLKKLSDEDYKALTTVGNTVNQKGLSSWTKTKRVGVGFTGEGKSVVLVQKGGKSARSLDLANMDEEEVIMSSNVAQKIVKVEHTEYGYDLVYVEEATQSNELLEDIFNSSRIIKDTDEATEQLWKKHYEVWHNSLSSNQQSSIYTYTGQGYKRINNYLRGLKVDTSAYSLDETIQSVADIVEAFQKAPKLTENIKVYRQCYEDAFEGIDLNNVIGQVFTDKGFLSTSVVEGATGNTAPIMFEISLPKGTRPGAYIANNSKFSGETEFLLKPGAPIRLISKEVKPNGDIILKGVYIDE